MWFILTQSLCVCFKNSTAIPDLLKNWHIGSLGNNINQKNMKTKHCSAEPSLLALWKYHKYYEQKQKVLNVSNIC